jgi:hypothetical protein
VDAPDFLVPSADTEGVTVEETTTPLVAGFDLRIALIEAFTGGVSIEAFPNFSHMSEGVTNKSFGDGTPRERILLQGTGSVRQPRGSEARLE